MLLQFSHQGGGLLTQRLQLTVKGCMQFKQEDMTGQQMRVEEWNVMLSVPHA